MQGVQLARIEAIRRNRQVCFDWSGIGTGWTVSTDCLSAPGVAAASQTIQKQPNREGSVASVVAMQPAGSLRVMFNGYGRVVPNIVGGSSISQIDVTATRANLRRRVLISSGDGGGRLLRFATPVRRRHADVLQLRRTMKTVNQTSQGGFALIEALISIAIFSFALIGLVSLQSAAIASTTDAKMRSDASFLADQIIGQAWSDRGNIANYNHLATGAPCTPGGAASINPAVLAWLAESRRRSERDRARAVACSRHRQHLHRDDLLEARAGHHVPPVRHGRADQLERMR